MEYVTHAAALVGLCLAGLLFAGGPHPRRWPCLLGWHRPHAGIDPQVSIRWICSRCGEVRPGQFGARR